MDDFERHLLQRQRANRATTREWDKHNDRIGMVGEKAVCERYGAKQDLRDKRKGDGGIDIEFKIRGVWEEPRWVKFSIRASMLTRDALVVNCDKLRTDAIYVYARVTDMWKREGYCVGWVSGLTLFRSRSFAPIMGEWAYRWHGFQSMIDLDRMVCDWRWSDLGVA